MSRRPTGRESALREHAQIATPKHLRSGFLNLMLPYRDSRLARIMLGVFFLIVLLYAYYEARGILYGPKISIQGETTVVHEPFVYIRGAADRISRLTMNGKPVPVTEKGEFKEPYLLSAGYNRIVLEASDKYGRTREQVIEIAYIPEEKSASASSTTQTSN